LVKNLTKNELGIYTYLVYTGVKLLFHGGCGISRASKFEGLNFFGDLGQSIFLAFNDVSITENGFVNHVLARCVSSNSLKDNKDTSVVVRAFFKHEV